MIITPIFIQQPPAAPATCPSCGKEENIVAVCGHCRYEYPEEEDTRNWLQRFWSNWSVLIIALLAVFFLSSLGIWAMRSADEYHPYTGTYVEFLGDIFRYLWKKIILRLF